MFSFYSSRYTLSLSLGQHTRCIAPTNAEITYKFPMTTSLITYKHYAGWRRVHFIELDNAKEHERVKDARPDRCNGPDADPLVVHLVVAPSFVRRVAADKHETKPGEISQEIEAPCGRSPVKTLDRASNDNGDQVKDDKQEANNGCSAQPPMSRGELGRLA